MAPPPAGLSEIEISNEVFEKGLLTHGEAARLRALASKEKNGQALIDELVEQLLRRGRHPAGLIDDPIGYLVKLKTSSGLTRSGEGQSRRLHSMPSLSIGQILAQRGGL